MKKFLILCLMTAWLVGAICKADGLNKSFPLHLTYNTSSLDVIVGRNIIHFMDVESEYVLQQRIDNLQHLLNIYFTDHPHAPNYDFTFSAYPEFNARMAAIASCSKQWNLRTGQAKNNNTANWLRETLNQAQVFHELVPIFAKLGYQIEIASLESIILCHSKEIDWENTPRSCQNALSAQDKLPCGALLSFKLKSMK
jgi:hypothetical protein